MKVEQVLKSVWDEFVYGGHLLSLGSVSIVFSSALILNIPITWDFLLIVYLITYTVYLYDRFRGLKQDLLTNYNRTQHITKYIRYIPLIISCSILIIIGMLLYFGNQSSLVFGLLALLFGLSYSVFFKKITKKVVGFKNFYVAFEWSLVVIFLTIYYSFSLNLSVLFLFIFVFLRWLIHEIFFDIKDIKSDKKENLLTLPIAFGEQKVLNIINLLNISTVVIVLISVYLNLFPKFVLLLLPLIFYSIYYFKELEKTSVPFSYVNNIFINGEYILWTVFILTGKFLYNGV